MAANPIATFTKDPSAVLDYTVDWTDYLGSDTISTVTWTVAVGITQSASMFASKTATIWLSGGTAGTNYTVACLVVTAAGRTDERTIQINVVDR